MSRNLLRRFSFFFLFLSSLILFVPAAWGKFTHFVKKGESLSTISRLYHIPISRIQEANGLKGALIRIGQPLIIPLKPSKVQVSSPNPGSPNREGQAIARRDPRVQNIHVVKKGENLLRIAKQHHLRVREIQEMNGLKGDMLRIGQVLRLKREVEKQRVPGTDPGEANRERVLTQAAIAPIPEARAPATETPGRDRGNRTLVEVALNFLGVKYRRGGTSIVHGLDCSAFAQKTFQVMGLDLPRTVREQFQVGLKIAREALRLGDLVFFKTQKALLPTHVGIYIGNGHFIHVSLSRRKVTIDSLDNRYFSTRFMGGRRIREPEKQPEIPKHTTEYALASASMWNPSGPSLVSLP